MLTDYWHHSFPSGVVQLVVVVDELIYRHNGCPVDEFEALRSAESAHDRLRYYEEVIKSAYPVTHYSPAPERERPAPSKIRGFDPQRGTL